jgi:hypothetical protein
MMKPATRQMVCVFAGILALAALSCSGAANVANLFATDTPTPTSTFTPSPTLTPSPTSTATFTPSPSPTPKPAGVKAEEQADGSTFITDYDNHYLYILPANWKVPFISQKDLQEAVQADANSDPELADFVDQFKDLDPDIFRLAALNVDRKYLDSAGAPTLLTANAYEDPIASTMPMAFVTAMIEDNILKDARNTSWEVTNSGNGVEVGIVTGENTFNFSNGVNVNVEQIVIAFQANQKIIIIEIAAPQGYGDEILASFDGMIDSIKVEPE